MEDKSLDILLPCYNPKSDWVDTLQHNMSEINGRYPQIDINYILVDDGSHPPISKKENFSKLSKVTLITNAVNKGKGYAIREAAKASSADFIIYTDVDFPYTVQSLSRVLDQLIEKNSDVVLAIRSEAYYAKIPKSRRRISLLLKNINGKLMKLITSDTQCGLKGMNQKGKACLLSTSINRYLFDLEFVKLISTEKSLKTDLVEVELRENVTFSKVPVTKLLHELKSYVKILFFR